MKTIQEYEIIDHGVEHTDYFQGCGVAFTRFEECFTGIGWTFREALQNAVDDAAVAGYSIPEALEDEIKRADDTSKRINAVKNSISPDGNADTCDVFHHVSIRVK